MATTDKWIVSGTTTTIMSTELNSAAAGTIVKAGSTFNNTQGSTGDGYTLCTLTITLPAPSAAFAAASSFDVWLAGSGDSTPNDAPDVQFDISSLATSYTRSKRVMLPPGTIQPYARNSQGSGSQALAAAGNTIALTPFTDQGV